MFEQAKTFYQSQRNTIKTAGIFPQLFKIPAATMVKHKKRRSFYFIFNRLAIQCGK